MKIFVLLAMMFSFLSAHADDKIKMSFRDEELIKIIEAYSKATGQKFVVDPAVRGKISIILPEAVSKEEAFNHLSSALAINGFGISKQGDTMVIKNARNIQRDLIEVSSEIPTVKPERMYTWVYTAKNVAAMDINRDIRTLASKDGEMVVSMKTNQLIFTDWTANLNRIAEMMKKIDVKPDPSVAKIIEDSRKERELREARQRKDGPKPTHFNE